MTVSVTHRFVSPVADAGNPDELGPNEWNDTHVITGLENVDNTSDANKPVSTAQQAALDLKANIASPTFTGTVGGITKSMVGLGNVDNTTDAGKPVSTATQTALDVKSNIASPTFTGTPAAPTATADTSTTQLATTAYVVGQAASVAPLMDGTAAVGTSKKYARQDHVHASDTSKVTGPASAVDGDVALFDSTTGKVIKSGGGYIWAGLHGRIFTPEQSPYNAVGDGSTDDTAAITSMITAAKAAAASDGSAQIIFTRQYKTTDTITLASWTGTLHIQFQGNAGIKLVTSATGKRALAIGGITATATQHDITSDILAGSSVIPVTGGAFDYLGGDYIVVFGSTGIGTYVHQQLCKVKSIDSSAQLSIEGVSHFPVAAATAMPSGYGSTNPYIQKYTLETGRLIMEGGTFDGAGVTGADCTGLVFQGLVDADISRIRTSNFNASDGVGATFQYFYGGKIADVFDVSSGNASVSSAALSTQVLTGAILDGWYSLKSSGFGILLNYLNGCRELNMRVIGAAGRGLKHWACCEVEQVNLTADSNGFTGIDYDSVSLNNRGSNFCGNNNGDQGVHFIGSGSTGNFISGVNARNNNMDSPQDIGFADSVAADSNNHLVGVNDDAIIGMGTTTTGVTVETIRKQNIIVKLAADKSIATSTKTDIAFDTVVKDSHSEFNTGTGVFTAKYPGFRRVQIVASFTASVAIAGATFVYTDGTPAENVSFFGASGDGMNRFIYDKIIYFHTSDTIAPAVFHQNGSSASLDHTYSQMIITSV